MIDILLVKKPERRLKPNGSSSTNFTILPCIDWLQSHTIKYFDPEKNRLIFICETKGKEVKFKIIRMRFSDFVGGPLRFERDIAVPQCNHCDNFPKIIDPKKTQNRDIVVEFPHPFISEWSIQCPI